MRTLTAVTVADPPVVVAVYGSDTCLYTSDIDDFMTRLAATRPQLRIDRYDVNTPEGPDRFARHMDAVAHTGGSIPVVVVDHQVFIGSSDETRSELTAAVDVAIANTSAAPAPAATSGGWAARLSDPGPWVFVWFSAPLVAGIFVHLLSPNRPATVLSHMAGMPRDRSRTRTVPSAPDRMHTRASGTASAGRDDTPRPVIDIAPPGPDDSPPPGPTDIPPANDHR